MRFFLIAILGSTLGSFVIALATNMSAEAGLKLALASLVGFVCIEWWHLHKRPEPQAQDAPPPRQEYAPPPPPPPPAPEVFPLLKLRSPFTRAEAMAAFRRRSMELHPDHGGDVGLFRMLLAERKRAMELPP